MISFFGPGGQVVYKIKIPTRETILGRTDLRLRFSFNSRGGD